MLLWVDPLGVRQNAPPPLDGLMGRVPQSTTPKQGYQGQLQCCGPMVCVTVAE
jgi:hypothetical protein